MRKLTLIKRLRKDVSRCENCSLCVTRNNPVVDSGPLDAKVMIIGEAPGELEDRVGKPFVGRSGKLLDWALSKAGLSRKTCYVTNILKSRPPDNKISEGGVEWVEACRPFLIRQIEIIRPRIIVTLGRVATAALLNSGDTTMGELVGGEFRQYDDTLVIPTWHPSYVLRRGNRKDLVRHLRTVARLLER
jgi:DNA polymerase